MKLVALAIVLHHFVCAIARKISEDAVHSRVCLDDAWASNLMCSNTPRPKVAVCIAGTARTFTKTPVHRSIQTNLIEAFGGDVTIFAAIKTRDLRGDGGQGYNGLIHSNDADVRATLTRLGVKPENTVVGNNSYPAEKNL